MYYVAANGTPIHNEGEKQIEGKSDEGINVSMTMQVADVSNTLAGTSKVCDAGNMQLFTRSNGGTGSNPESQGQSRHETHRRYVCV